MNVAGSAQSPNHNTFSISDQVPPATWCIVSCSSVWWCFLPAGGQSTVVVLLADGEAKSGTFTTLLAPSVSAPKLLLILLPCHTLAEFLMFKNLAAYDCHRVSAHSCRAIVISFSVFHHDPYSSLVSPHSASEFVLVPRNFAMILVRVQCLSLFGTNNPMCRS